MIASIRRDISDRPGDLALVQMALYAMWQKHKADGAGLLVAYSEVGGVAGALAHEAERCARIVSTRASANARAAVRPVGPSRRDRRRDAAGRRTCRSRPPRRALAAKLATEECARLLLAGETSVEIAHEALITQWPWLQNTLQQAAADMRVLDGLMDKTRRWAATGSRKAEHLAAGAEREEFAALADASPTGCRAPSGSSSPRARKRSSASSAPPNGFGEWRGRRPPPLSSCWQRL